MALLHKATLTPSKIDLLAEYLRSQPFTSSADCAELVALGAYRFDDPTGEVGIECHLVRGATNKVLHVPVTYRAEPLDVTDDWLVGTIDHSVLGQRWVYNACIDPVYVTALVRTMIDGGTQAEQYFETAEGREYKEPTALVTGSGIDMAIPTLESLKTTHRGNDSHINIGSMNLRLRHVVHQPVPARPKALLSGTWPDQDEPLVLAHF